MYVHAGAELAQAAHAIERHRLAMGAGDATAIASARYELELAQKALKRVKSEAVALAEIAKALGNGRKITWQNGLTS
jgi:CRISPR/Cas system endoribonuclease Cas6 (RAMP superfamily)